MGWLTLEIFCYMIAIVMIGAIYAQYQQIATNPLVWHRFIGTVVDISNLYTKDLGDHSSVNQMYQRLNHLNSW